MRVMCFAPEHNTVSRPVLEPGPFDPERSALTAPSTTGDCNYIRCIILSIS